VDRRLYKLPFYEKVLPQWTCPACGKGVLRLVKDTFLKKETAKSKRAYRSSEGNQLDVEYVYSCLLECSNVSCKDKVVSTGIGFVDIDYVQDEGGDIIQVFSDYFRPKFFQPHLKPFVFPKGTPVNVMDEIEQSFQLFFCNPPSASNHIRIALEDLLTHLKVKRFETKAGKRRYLGLNRRIQLVPKKYEHIKELFLAIKWLGDAGSHSNKEITFDDVMDVYEIMDEVLKELFANKKDNIKKLVKQINKKKGPKGKKR
jgi:hypothetical protein